MKNWMLSIAALFGGSAVMLGAFASHGLRGSLSERMLETFQTGVQYQMYHALALLAVGILYRLWPSKLLAWAAGLFIVGILLFSGSLYVLALGGPRWFGPITPIGGLCYIAAWICLALACWRLPKS
jgi:uncharacterized membrane protein YgdD (TMEM256/DUF423 family)